MNLNLTKTKMPMLSMTLYITFTLVGYSYTMTYHADNDVQAKKSMKRWIKANKANIKSWGFEMTPKNICPRYAQNLAQTIDKALK